MNKFKSIKLIAMILVFSLLLSNVAMAKQNNGRSKDKNKVNWNQAYKKYVDQYKKWERKTIKKFDDVESEHWANKYIERMGAKNLIVGDGNGKFIPNKPTKNIEAIVMTIRMMGWEDDAKAIDKLPDDLEDLDIPQWATGYITLAYEKGLITKNELEDFSANAAVKRYVVAKYIIRALGLEDKALENMNEFLEFKDASSIPEGHRGYIYLINKLGLMSGYKNKFNPNGNLTRAEMATLFSRLDDKIESEEDEVEMGEFVQITDGIITINKETEQERYLLSENVIVYNLEGKEIELEDIEAGDKLQLEFFDHKVVYIEIIKEEKEKVLKLYEGEVTKIVVAAESAVSIKIDDKKKTFVLSQDTVIKKEGQDDELQVSDITIGDIVKITEITEGNEVNITEVEIQVQEAVTSIYEGAVISLTETTTNKLITILYSEEEDDDEYEDKTFVIGEDTIIKKEGHDGTLQVRDIAIGDIVKITEVTENDEVNVIKIEIQVQEAVTRIYEGEVISLTETTTSNVITIVYYEADDDDDDQDEEDRTFVIGEDTIIKKEGHNGSFQVSDIKIGDKVKITEITKGDDSNVTEIEIQVQEPITKVYEGEVISLAETTSERLITIRIGDDEKTFAISEDTIVKKEGQNEAVSISHIKLTDEVRVTEVTLDDNANVILITILV